MNSGTKIRSIVALIAALNEALMAFGVTYFADVNTDTIYKVVSTIFMVVSWLASHYYNNDFTEEACEGTGLTRYLKALKKDGAVPMELIDVEDGEEVADDVEENLYKGDLK